MVSSTLMILELSTSKTLSSKFVFIFSTVGEVIIESAPPSPALVIVANYKKEGHQNNVKG